MKVCSECQRCFEDAVEYCTEMHGQLSESRQGSVSMIPGYLIEERLYVGLRGEIFRAVRTDCGRSCLIQIVSADNETGNQFLEEARRTADLFHPNLAAVYESGTCNTGELYVVSEDLQDSETLRTRLETGGLPELLESIRIVRIAAETLHELHRAGVIHRAVCPENILISTDYSGETQLRFRNVDLGGAGQRSIISNKFLIDTETPAIRYFAPEQCSGEPATARSDVYSLGILLYELIAGAPPFEADRASGVIEQHRSSRPPEVKIDNFDLRMLITHTLMESLGKRPELRQSTADLFARQLRHIELLATHVSTPPPAVTVESPRPMPKPPQSVAMPAQPVAMPPQLISKAPQPVVSREVPRVIPVAEPEFEVRVLQELAAEPEPAFTFAEEPRLITEVVLQGQIDPEPQAVPLPRANGDDAMHRISRLTRLKARHRQLRILPEPSEIKAATQAAKLDPPEMEKIDVAAVNEEKPVAFAAAASSTEGGSSPLPKIVQWNEPLDDIPSLEETLEVLHAEGDPTVAFDPAAINAVEEPAQASPVFQQAATHERSVPSVSTRTKSFGIIGLNLDSPVSIDRPRGQAELRTAHFDDSDEIFSSVQRLSAVPFARLRRGIGVGAIAGALVLAFLLRGDIVEAFTPFDLETLHPPQSHVAAGTVPVAVHNKPDTIYSKPVVDSPALVDAPAAVKINGPEFKRPETPAAREVVQPTTPLRNAKTGRTPDKPAPDRSPTRVLTYTVPKKEKAARAKERDASVTRKNAPGLTRPRIVANPIP